MRFRVAFAVAVSLAVVSCAELRLQTVNRSAWLSKAGDPASLAKLRLLDQGKTTPGNDAHFVQIERGSQVNQVEFSKKHCGVRRVFEKVQVRSGSRNGFEGWMCGASIAHHEVAAL